MENFVDLSLKDLTLEEQQNLNGGLIWIFKAIAAGLVFEGFKKIAEKAWDGTLIVYPPGVGPR